MYDNYKYCTCERFAFSALTLLVEWQTWTDWWCWFGWWL